MKIPVEDANRPPKDWNPLFKTLSMIAAVIVYAMLVEHRATVIEEQLKYQGVIIQQVVETQKLLAEQLRTTQQTLDRVVTLDEFFHGMSPDELEGFQAKKAKRR
jgi:hypothetical protein